MSEELDSLTNDFQKLNIDSQNEEKQKESSSKEDNTIEKQIEKNNNENEKVEESIETITKEHKNSNEKLKNEDQKKEIQDTSLEQKQSKQNEEHIIIKGTMRADGTQRKDIKVRSGYQNADMIKRYVIPQKRTQ